MQIDEQVLSTENSKKNLDLSARLIAAGKFDAGGSAALYSIACSLFRLTALAEYVAKGFYGMGDGD